MIQAAENLEVNLYTRDHCRYTANEYDVQRELARFAQTARDEMSLELLTAEISGVMQETVQPERITIWLKPLQEPSLRESMTDSIDV